MKLCLVKSRKLQEILAVVIELLSRYICHHECFAVIFWWVFEVDKLSFILHISEIKSVLYQVKRAYFTFISKLGAQSR